MFYMFFVDNSLLERRVTLLTGLLFLCHLLTVAFKLVVLHQRGEERVCLKSNTQSMLGELLSHRKISQHVQAVENGK